MNLIDLKYTINSDDFPKLGLLNNTQFLQNIVITVDIDTSQIVAINNLFVVADKVLVHNDNYIVNSFNNIE